MDMVSGEEITAAGLTDWRKLGQGLPGSWSRTSAPGPGSSLPSAMQWEKAGIISRSGWARASST